MVPYKIIDKGGKPNVEVKVGKETKVPSSRRLSSQLLPMFSFRCCVLDPHHEGPDSVTDPLP